ncbi:MAG: hypothetical protein QOK04_2654 [Solirubrobacteraceae bacterium]|nr:hypothetical protein [Solirubrobacteraceae bacterium]
MADSALVVGLWRCRVGVAFLLGGVGATMIALAVAASGQPARRALEVVFGAMVAVAGVCLLAMLRQRNRSAKAHFWVGEVAADGAFFYLAAAAPAFHGHGVSGGVARAQFVAALAGLLVSCVALAVRVPGRRDDRTLPVQGVVRDGVLLTVGTLVVAIAVGQLARPALSAPRWNWVSFLGLTVPGIVWLVFVRGPLELGARTRGQPLGVIGRGVSEVLLVVGLAVMIFGSVTNLTLGCSGFSCGFVGNGRGLVLWVGAAAFLVLARGVVKLRWPEQGQHPRRALASALLYTLGLVAFVYGERAVILGRPPDFSVGRAGASMLPIAVCGVAVLVALRPAVRPADRATDGGDSSYP